MKMNNESLPLSSKYLFEQLCTEAKLLEGWIAVKRNRGTSGIDGQTTEDFNNKLHEEISQLKTELQTWQYQPKPVRRVEIPKPGSKNDKRNLGIPTVRDRVVQAAIKQLLEPILDPLFSANSYGFRPGKNQRQAVEAAQEIIKSGNEIIVDIDLSKFFDRINQDRLIARLGNIIEDKRILRLIGMILRSGVMQDGVLTPTTEGATQGSPLSPLLSNLVLDELDKEIEKRGLKHCRFADDCNIFVKTAKAAERVMQSISKFIEKKLKLKVNQEKSKVAKSSLVKFLGMTIIDGARAIAKKSLVNALKKVKELTPKGTHEKLEVTIKRVNTWYMGWSGYYGMTQYPAQLGSVEGHIRRRLRSRIVDQQKSRRHLLNKLMKRGVSRNKAAKTCFSNMKRWALSHTNAVERAFSNQWFSDDMGLKTRSYEKREDWFDRNKWVCLV
jgi:group II intron reverse transcriptase/maturase